MMRWIDRRHDRSGKPQYNVLSATAIWVGGVIMIAIASCSVWLLLTFFGDPKDSSRLEVVKTAGTIVVGTGGAAALLLTARRQRFVELDGTERRITDLQAKAVEQLGSDQAAVRIAGLYALERLAQDNPSHRQTIVDIMCGYLRMPYTPPPKQSALPRNTTNLRPRRPSWMRPQTVSASVTASHDSRHEQQVRLTAQRILAAHLQPGPKGRFGGATNPKYWPHIDLDLTGATLADFDLHQCRPRVSVFRDAHFIGDTSFSEATFSGDAWFERVTFSGNVQFERVTFNGIATFNKATFDGNARFEWATFGGNARFERVTFNGKAWFAKATFSDNAQFVEATFGGKAGFSLATFTRNADFNGANFIGNAEFNTTTFSRNAEFDRATFTGNAEFNTTTFSRNVWFREATFCGNALFYRASLEKLADFREARAWKYHVGSRKPACVWPEGWVWGDQIDTSQGEQRTLGAWHRLALKEKIALPQNPVLPPAMEADK
jgi:pentapeptide repeat protein